MSNISEILSPVLTNIEMKIHHYKQIVECEILHLLPARQFFIQEVKCLGHLEHKPQKNGYQASC
jgi:hypothetical protein